MFRRARSIRKLIVFEVTRILTVLGNDCSVAMLSLYLDRDPNRRGLVSLFYARLGQPEMAPPDLLDDVVRIQNPCFDVSPR